MDLREFLVTNPTLNQELCNHLSFEDAVQLQVLFDSKQKINCTFEIADNKGRIYTLKGINSDTVRAYQLIHNKNSGEVFIKAAKEGDIETIRILLAIGINVNIVDQGGSTALMWASFFGYIEIVRLLLQNNANVNIVGRFKSTALMWATLAGNDSNDHSEIAKLLREHGAV